MKPASVEGDSLFPRVARCFKYSAYYRNSRDGAVLEALHGRGRSAADFGRVSAKTGAVVLNRGHRPNAVVSRFGAAL